MFAARFKRWRSRRRRRAAAKDSDNAPLREFIYVDDVSVTSLLASRIGELPTEITAQESNTLRTSVADSMSASAGLLKGGIEATLESTRSDSSQVLRKATVQSTFRQLVELERHTLGVGPSGPVPPPPQIQHTRDLRERIARRELDQWLVSELRRGRLVELEVELDAEHVFRVTAVIASMFDFVKDIPELLTALSQNLGFQQALLVYQALEKLLVGLVPLRGRSTEYVVLTLDGIEYVVRNELIAAIVDRADLVVRPLFVVGVAESGLFWKDLRRVLFSRSRYLMMCRVSRDGVHASWTPVKLLDVLAGLMPTVTDDWANAMKAFEAAMTPSDEQPASPSDSELEHEALAALTEFARRLSTVSGHTLTETELKELMIHAEAPSARWQTVADRRGLFADVAARLHEVVGIEASLDQVSNVRDGVLAEVGLGATDLPETLISVSSAADPTEARYLDTEVVAIYW